MAFFRLFFWCNRRRGSVILPNMGDICKICEKNGCLFATHSFTNSRKKYIGILLINRYMKLHVVSKSIQKSMVQLTIPIKYSGLTFVWDGHYSLNIMISFWRFSIGSLWGRSFFIKSMLAVVGRPRDAAWMNASLQENMRNF